MTKLAREVEQTFREFIYLPNDHSYTVATMWVMHTHLRTMEGEFLPYITPRLAFLSKSAGAGKTTALKIATYLSYNGQSVVDPTPPSIVTMIDSERATLGFDEIDMYFGRGFGKTSMRTVLNGGYEKGTYVTKRRQDELVRENIHAPVVMAGKNATVFLSADKFDTLRTRSLVILMTPKPVDADDYITEFDPELHIPRMRTLSERLKRWGVHNAPSIISQRPDIPREINNRNRAIWKVLFQIAHELGNEWPERVLAAANAFVLGKHEDNENIVLSPADELLEWVRVIFEDHEESIPSSVIVERLLDLPGNHWWQQEWTGERQATMSLARQLAVNGVEHSKLYINGSTPWGYKRVDLGLQPLQPVTQLPS